MLPQNELFSHISARITAGKPFTRAASAWTGGEVVTHLGDVAISFALIRSSLFVRAHSKTQYYGSIHAGERQGHGKYSLLIDEQSFTEWLASAGLIDAPAELPTAAAPAPVDVLAEELLAKYADLGQPFAGRLRKAVELYRAGYRSFDEYGTGANFNQSPPLRYCSCPDAEFRAPWVPGLGKSCKHSICQYLWDELESQDRQAQSRKLQDLVEGAHRQNALPAWAGQGRSIEEILG